MGPLDPVETAETERRKPTVRDALVDASLVDAEQGGGLANAEKLVEIGHGTHLGPRRIAGRAE